VSGSPIPERAPVQRDLGRGPEWFVEEDERVIRGGPYSSESEARAAITAWHAELGELYEAVEERARREGERVAWGPDDGATEAHSSADDHWGDEHDFPRADLETSRNDTRLQRQMRGEVERARRESPDLVCADCDSDEHVAVFWFSSPEWTWGPALCGRAGVVAWCDKHEQQIAFLLEVMS
jgi:hypothetical protein